MNLGCKKPRVLATKECKALDPKFPSRVKFVMSALRVLQAPSSQNHAHQTVEKAPSLFCCDTDLIKILKTSKQHTFGIQRGLPKVRAMYGDSPAPV